MMLDIKQQRGILIRRMKTMQESHSINVALNIQDKGFSPALQNAITLLNSVAKAKIALQKSTGSVVAAMSDVADAAKEQNKALDMLKTGFKGFYKLVSLVAGAIKIFEFAMKMSEKLKKSNTEAIDDKAIAKGNAKKATVADTTATKKATTAVTANTAALKKNKGAFNANAVAIKKSTAAINANATSTKKSTTAINASAAAIKKSTTAMTANAAATKKATVAITSQTAARGKSVKAIAAQSAALKKQAAVTKKASIAKKAFNLVLKANPIMLVVAAAAALIAIGSRLVNFFRRNSQAARENEERMNDLSNTWGRSSEDIRSEMEKSGLTMDQWEAKQTEALDTVASRWSVSADEIKAAMADQGITMDQWEAQQREGLQEVADQWGVSVDDIIAEMEKYGISQDQWAANQQSAWEDLQADIRQHTGNIVNNFRELPAGLDKSFEDMAAMLANNRKLYNEWNQNIQAISSEVCDAVLGMLKDLGTAGNELLEAALDPNNAGHEAAMEVIRELEAAVKYGTAIATGTAITCGEEVGEAYAEGFEHGVENVDYSTLTEPISNAAEANISVANQYGQETGEAYVEGVTEGLESVDFTPVVENMYKATNQMADNTANAMKTIKSVTREAMEYLNTTIVTNMGQAETSTRTSLERITAMFGSLRTTLPANLFIAGSNAMNSLRLGILSREPAIMATVYRIASNIQRTMRRAMQMNSPSRVMMKLGRGSKSHCRVA